MAFYRKKSFNIIFNGKFIHKTFYGKFDIFYKAFYGTCKYDIFFYIAVNKTFLQSLLWSKRGHCSICL